MSRREIWCGREKDGARHPDTATAQVNAERNPENKPRTRIKGKGLGLNVARSEKVPGEEKSGREGAGSGYNDIIT